jgi:integrase
MVWLDGKKNLAGRTQEEYERLVRVEVIPALGDKVLAQTSRSDWMDAIAKVAQRSPGVGVNLYRMCSSFLNHSEAMGWIDHTPLPRKGMRIAAPPPASRKRFLTDQELKAVWDAAETQVPKSRCFLRMLILTGARESEVAGVSIGELDLDAGLWSIPANRSKNKIGYTLPLSPVLISDLRAVMPNHDAGPTYKLLGHIKGSGMVSFSRLKRAIDRESGVRNWRLHDLRRTCRTGLAKLGISDEIAERCINHVSGDQMVGIYNQHRYAEEIVAALGRWQAHVMDLVSGPATAEVVPLRRKRA